MRRERGRERGGGERGGGEAHIFFLIAKESLPVCVREEDGKNVGEGRERGRNRNRKREREGFRV